MDPELVKYAALLLGGWALKFGWDMGADWLRRRGARKVKAALADLASAKLTSDDKDDVIAAMALDRAREDEEFMTWLATHVEKHKPTLPFPGVKQ